MAHAADRGSHSENVIIGRFFQLEKAGEVQLCAVYFKSRNTGIARYTGGNIHVVHRFTVFGVGDYRKIVCVPQRIAGGGAGRRKA